MCVHISYQPDLTAREGCSGLPLASQKVCARVLGGVHYHDGVGNLERLTHWQECSSDINRGQFIEYTAHIQSHDSHKGGTGCCHS